LQEEYLAPRRLEQLKEAVRRRARSKHQVSPEKAGRLRARLEQLDADIKQGARNLLRAGPNIDLANEALSELRAERAEVARDLEAAERTAKVPPEQTEQTVDAAIAELHRLRERLAEADPEKVRDVLRRIVSSIDLYFEPQPKKVKVYHRLVRGVVKLRPQLDVSRIKECHGSSRTRTSITSTAFPLWWTALPSGR